MIERRVGRRAALLAVAGLSLLASAALQAAERKAEVPVASFTLDNGMRFLLVRRPEMATVTAGWVAHVGSSNERPGITGLSHLFEHMMFKGTQKIGSKNIERDLQILAEQEALQERIREQYRGQRERWRKGEIADPFDPAARPQPLIELEQQFAKLVEEQRGLMIKDELDRIYTEAGASGLNAFTNEDMTVYFITVPANKLELWFWMESDRLAQPVFREFYSERDVVHEERRLRTESTPTGKFDEAFNALFWQSHPYAWPVVGWPSDLRTISKAQADAYFGTYYAPNNLTAALVGNLDLAEAERLARRYFERLKQGAEEPGEVVTLEMPQLAEQRLNGECDCQPQVLLQYHSVPFGHADSYPLEVLAGVLNGQTGRLYKGLVLGRQIAASATATQESKRWAGYFGFQAETKGEANPAALEAAWYEELARLQKEDVPELELEKVKNQIAADAFRRLENPFFLLLQLLYYDGLGDWRYLSTWADRTLAVTAADVRRVATSYFTRENRAVATYARKPGTAAAALPPELEALPAEMRPMAAQQLQRIAAETDRDKLVALRDQLEQGRQGAPPEMQPMIELLFGAVERRLEELAGNAGENPPAVENGGGAQ